MLCGGRLNLCCAANKSFFDDYQKNKGKPKKITYILIEAYWYKLLGFGCKSSAKGGIAMDMNIRARTQAVERETLSPHAALSEHSRGRLREEEECPVRTVYQRDRDRIIHSTAFRRLKHKTQVFLAPEGDHYRTRLTHTLEVAQIARTIARGLRLNEDLTEAAALGHDLGHTPFGHAGERALNAVFPGGFQHYNQSLRVVDRLEKNGLGLNLTYEVRDGIRCHTSGEEAGTLEGRIVLAITPFVMKFASLNDTAMHYLKYMLLINTYYIMGSAVNTALIAGVFRAGGDTKFGLICDTVDMWVYAVPLGFFAAFVLKLPVLWVYFLLCTDEFVKWPWVFHHYRKGEWAKNITREDIFEQ